MHTISKCEAIVRRSSSPTTCSLALKSSKLAQAQEIHQRHKVRKVHHAARAEWLSVHERALSSLCAAVVVASRDPALALSIGHSLTRAQSLALVSISNSNRHLHEEQQQWIATARATARQSLCCQCTCTAPRTLRTVMARARRARRLVQTRRRQRCLASRPSACARRTSSSSGTRRSSFGCVLALRVAAAVAERVH